MAKWIDFVPFGESESGKTKVWRVRARDGGDVLGEVKWFSRWRRYAFYPVYETVFEPACLRDLADFCEAETKTHRAAAR